MTTIDKFALALSLRWLFALTVLRHKMPLPRDPRTFHQLSIAQSGSGLVKLKSALEYVFACSHSALRSVGQLRGIRLGQCRHSSSKCAASTCTAAMLLATSSDWLNACMRVGITTPPVPPAASLGTLLHPSPSGARPPSQAAGSAPLLPKHLPGAEAAAAAQHMAPSGSPTALPSEGNLARCGSTGALAGTVTAVGLAGGCGAEARPVGKAAAAAPRRPPYSQSLAIGCPAQARCFLIWCDLPVRGLRHKHRCRCSWEGASVSAHRLHRLHSSSPFPLTITRHHALPTAQVGT